MTFTVGHQVYERVGVGVGCGAGSPLQGLSYVGHQPPHSDRGSMDRDWNVVETIRNICIIWIYFMVE